MRLCARSVRENNQRLGASVISELMMIGRIAGAAFEGAAEDAADGAPTEGPGVAERESRTRPG